MFWEANKQNHIDTPVGMSERVQWEKEVWGFVVQILP